MCGLCGWRASLGLQISHTPLLLSRLPGPERQSELAEGEPLSNNEGGGGVFTDGGLQGVAESPCGNTAGGTDWSTTAEECIIGDFLRCMQSHAG